MDKRPHVGTAAIILQGTKVLSGKRKNAVGQGQWAFPGGHLEFGEDPKRCIIREVMEEVGIVVQNPVFQTFTNDINTKTNMHYITLFYLCEYVSGTIQNMEPDKCEGWEWHEWNNLPKPQFLPEINLLKQGYTPF